MLRVLLAASLLLAPLTLPAASAFTFPCEWRTDDEQDKPVYTHNAADGTQIWRETNGVAGLQRTSCIHNGQEVAADEHVTTVDVPSINRCPIDLGGTLVCII